MTHEPTNETPSTTTKTYDGSCHCGAVRFRAKVDLSAGVAKCNCTMCRRLNFLGARVRPDAFEQVSGKDALTEYMWGTKVVHHLFCKHCGIRAFGHANIPQAGGEYYSVNVYCLEGADVTSVPVKYCDGLHNNWWNDAPAFP